MVSIRWVFIPSTLETAGCLTVICVKDTTIVYVASAVRNLALILRLRATQMADGT